MKITNLFITLILLLTIVSCQKDTPTLTTRMDYVGECMDSKTDKSAAFSYHSSTSTLNIHKFYTDYPCKGEINISAEIKNNTIKITEQVIRQTECTCLKNISYTIGNIPSGEYKISLNDKIIGNILVY